MTEYSDKLKDPRWQKKRLKILERDNWTCQRCMDTSSTLAIHHRRYLPGKEPWDYPDEFLVTLCEDCHAYERDTLPSVESDLLSMLRPLFMADDIHRLATGFSQLTLLHTPEVVSTVFQWALTCPEIQRELIERFFISTANALKEESTIGKTSD